MKYDEKVKALVAAILDGATVQYKDSGGRWFDDDRRPQILIPDLLADADKVGVDSYRLKPKGQHMYALVVRYEELKGNVVILAHRNTFTDVQRDVQAYTGPNSNTPYKPVYVLHHEFDPEDGSLRKTNTISIEEVTAA